MIVHVKVNKSTNFQQLNPICVTVSSEKVLKLTQFQTQTITTHVARCYWKLTIGHRTQLMSTNYDCACESEQKYQFSTTKSHLCDCKVRKGTETHTISNTDYYHTCC